MTLAASRLRRLGRAHALAAATLLIAFNVWHLTNRGSWHGSPGDALTLGPEIREFAARVDPSLRVHQPYDGQFYYAMAFDPWLRSHEVVALLDDPGYRYRRILLPALGWTLALGRPARLPLTLLAVNFAAWLACGWAAWQLARRDGLPPAWLAFGVLVTTGLVYSTFRTLQEPLAMALVLAGLLFLHRNRAWTAAALFGVAALAREEALLVPLVVVVHAVLGEHRSLRRLLPFLALALAPAVLWRAWLAFELPPAAVTLGDRLSWPFAGMLEETSVAFELNRTRTHLLRSLTATAIAAWLCLEAFLGLRRTTSLWGLLAFGQAVLTSLLRGDVWTYWAGSIRVIVPLSIFSLFWFFERARGDRPVAAAGGES